MKKGIEGHKLGAAGFKANNTGAYFNALETVNDTFKLLEDAITATGVNTAERKYLTIGINADSQSSYLQDQDRYDIEGPKNLFDQTMLADWFVKMAQDHKLLTYIEDPFAEGDILGYQKMMRRFKDTQVKVGVKSWFGSDLEKIQEFTQLISVDEPDEEEAKEEEEQVEEEKVEEEEKKEEEVASPKKGEKPAAGAKGKGGKEEVPKEVLNTNQDEADDPNAMKFVPDLIHFDRAQHQST